jgi:ABC-2 type transport system ATP-binding protein
MVVADNVTVIFKRGFLKRKILALNGFSIHIRRGDVFGLVGPNGAGKSTAMYTFLGLIKPDRGEVRLFGERPEPGSTIYNQIAYVPEDPHYHLYLTVEEAVRYYAALYSDPVPESRIQGAIARMGLGEFRDLRLEKCSKGMKQKAGLAICLISDPELVFLDEPTRGLDPITVKDFRDIILEMNKKGTTFVINSHVLSEVEMICNRVAIMDRGKVVVQDEMAHLLKYDQEVYEVDLALTDAPPPFLTVKQQGEGRLKGEVPGASLRDFLRFIEERNLKLYECSLKKATLEEAFFKTIRKGS